MQKSKRLAGEELYEAAVAALARRDRSVAGMRQWLRPRALHAADLEGVMQRLRDRGYLDDARFAALAAAHHLEGERHGARRAERELRAHGVAAALAERAIAGAYAGTDENALLRAYIRKKRMRRPEGVRQAAAAYRRWLLAGFSPAACRRALAAWKLDAEWLEAIDAALEAASDALDSGEPEDV